MIEFREEDIAVLFRRQEIAVSLKTILYKPHLTENENHVNSASSISLPH